MYSGTLRDVDDLWTGWIPHTPSAAPLKDNLNSQDDIPPCGSYPIDRGVASFSAVCAVRLFAVLCLPQVPWSASLGVLSWSPTAGTGAGRSHHLGHTYRLPSFRAMFLELCYAACDLAEEFLFFKTASLQMLLISVMSLSFVMITPKLKLASGVSCLTI